MLSSQLQQDITSSKGKKKSIHPLTCCILKWQEHGLCQRFHVFTPLHFSALGSFHTELRCFDKELAWICCLHAEKKDRFLRMPGIWCTGKIASSDSSTKMPRPLTGSDLHITVCHSGVKCHGERAHARYDVTLLSQLSKILNSSMMPWYIRPARSCGTGTESWTVRCLTSMFMRILDLIWTDFRWAWSEIRS